MIDLSINCAGIRSPNPFWLASAPPSYSAYQVCKAFEQGWRGKPSANRWCTLCLPLNGHS